jgi:prepilin-type processing-associated H-X9-DG protein
MGSRSGMEPLILRARRSFEPARWQGQTLATAYRLVIGHSGRRCQILFLDGRQFSLSGRPASHDDFGSTSGASLLW